MTRCFGGGRRDGRRAGRGPQARRQDASVRHVGIFERDRSISAAKAAGRAGRNRGAPASLAVAGEPFGEAAAVRMSFYIRIVIYWIDSIVLLGGLKQLTRCCTSNIAAKA
ncbi:hypothetical protein N3919_03110 [Bosea minatitlanensis]|nr:hypothetical protein [Bosea minatitlanensis]